MAEQPQTQEELVRSVVTTFADAKTPKVIPTIATRSWLDLSTNSRALAAQYLSVVQANQMTLNQLPAGATVEVQQTDNYHISTPSHEFNTLSNLVSIIGQRSR